MSKLNKSLILLCIISMHGCAKAPPAQKPPHTVTVTQAMTCDVPIYIDYVGNLVAKTNVTVRAEVSGNVVGQYYIEGQEVKKGTLLIVIDPRPYIATLDKAKAALAQTWAQLQLARDTAKRNAKLVQEDYVSQLTYDNYITQVLTNEALLGQNKADLKTAEINLGYCYITAPMDSVTGKLLVKTGNYVDSNANTALTTLNQIQPMLVDFYIPESDLLTIQEQQQKFGNLKLFVYPNPDHKKSFAGELTLIDNQISTSTGAVLLEGTLQNEEKLLWPGHYVDVRLILGEKKGALLLPIEAVQVGQSGHYVYTVKSDQTIEMKTVKVGQTYDHKYITVESGITTSDQVVLEGQLNLFPGAKVLVEKAGGS